METLLSRLVRARRFTDADDIAAVLHYRVAKATERPAGSGCARKLPRLIAGLIPEAGGTMSPEFRQALTGRRDLIEARADAILDAALTEGQSWTATLGSQPKQARAALAWRQAAHTVAAYRDRHNITDASPLGAPTESDTQKIDAARARSALDRARRLADAEPADQQPAHRTGPERVGPTLQTQPPPTVPTTHLLQTSPPVVF